MKKKKEVKTNLVHLCCSAVFSKTKRNLKRKFDFLQEKVIKMGHVTKQQAITVESMLKFRFGTIVGDV